MTRKELSPFTRYPIWPGVLVLVVVMTVELVVVAFAVGLIALLELAVRG